MWPWAAFDQSLQNNITGSEGRVADWNTGSPLGGGDLTVMGRSPGSMASFTRDAKSEPLNIALSSSHSPCACTTPMGALMPNALMSSLHPRQPAAHPSPRARQSLCLPRTDTEPSQSALPHPPAACAPEETVYRPGLSDAPSFRRNWPVSLDLPGLAGETRGPYLQCCGDISVPSWQISSFTNQLPCA